MRAGSVVADQVLDGSSASSIAGIVSVKDQPLASAELVYCWLRFKWTTRRSVARSPFASSGTLTMS